MTEILITSSVLILALLLLRKVFSNRLSRRVQYALWALVLVRLLLPVQLPAMDFSVLNAAKPVEEAVTRTVVERPIYVPVAQAPLEEVPATVKSVPERNELPVGKSVWVAQEEQQTAVQYKRISPETILFWVWLTGCATAAALLLLTNLRFWLWLRKVRKPFEVQDCKLRVYLVEAGLPAPCLFGLFRPAIYLTPGAVETPETLRHVLAHEKTHARHLDHLWTFLRGVCLALYWFDPLVWAAAAAAKTDCELACDEGALARLNEEDRIPYGETLLSLAVVRETGNPMLAATAMTTGKQRLKERVTRIAHKSRQTVAAVVAVSLLVGAVSACTFSGGKEAETGPLRICVDTGFHSRSDSVPASDVKNGAKFLTQMVALHLDMDVEDIELEIIPKGGTERKTALTRIRTEIMSGEGPDVFLCSTVDTSAYGSSETVLFPFPERAMADGLFLPLDHYLEKAEYMELDKMLPAAMEAGKTESGQMILPISYTLWVTAYKEEDAQLPAVDTTFADVIASNDPILQSTLVCAGRYDEYRLRCSFPYLFTEIADYRTGELSITEEDLHQTIQAVAALQAQDPVELPSHFSEQLALDTFGWSHLVPLGIFDTTEQVMLPVYNWDGGATALICSFGAVNANTRKPKSAFLVLDYFLSSYMHRNSELYAFFCENSLPVHTEMGSTRDAVKTNGVTVEPYRVKNCTPLDSEAFTAYSDAREQISYARFNTVLDQELMKFATFSSGSIVADNEEALRKNVSDTYTKMQRLLDES